METESGKHFTVITIGNVLIDAFLSFEERNPFIHVDQQHKELCFAFGRKIHVEECTFLLGGNACNVGVGVSRFGLTAALFVEIGDDEFSQKIIALLSHESIDTSFVLKTKNSSSSFAISINVQKERTLFVDHVKREHQFVFDDLTTEWVYLTSLGKEWKNAYIESIAFAKKTGAKLAFSPGTHQLEGKEDEVFQALSACDILCVNKEEAQNLLSYYVQTEETEIVKLLRGLQQIGAKTVSITDGANGSYSIDGAGAVRTIGTFPAEIVERTGAGDAYATGFLSALVSGRDVSEAMIYGAINAASVIEKIGSQAGLLGKQALEEKAKGHPEFVPKVT